MKENIILNNKLIGYIETEKGVYVSFRTRNHQFLKMGRGFGISYKVLDLLESRKINKIVINFENFQSYCAEASDFLINGIDYVDGEDKQLILPLKFWRKDFVKPVSYQQMELEV